MKRVALVVLGVIVLTLSSCTLFTSIFGPNKNKVVAWVPSLSVGSKISYKETFSSTDPAETGYTYNFSAEVQDVVVGSDRTTMKMNWDGTTIYAIYDNNRSKMYVSFDDTVNTDTDYPYLATPIESGTTWYGAYMDLVDFFGGYFTNTNYKISDTKQTVTLGTETAKDVVVINANLSSQADPNGLVKTLQFKYSPSYGIVGETIEIQANGYTYTDTMTVTDINKA